MRFTAFLKCFLVLGTLLTSISSLSDWGLLRLSTGALLLAYIFIFKSHLFSIPMCQVL